MTAMEESTQVERDTFHQHRIIFTKAKIQQKAICAVCSWEVTAANMSQVQTKALRHLDCPEDLAHQEPLGFAAVVDTRHGRWVRMNTTNASMPWVNENSRIQGHWNDISGYVTCIVSLGV